MAEFSQGWAEETGWIRGYIRANAFARKAILSFCLHALLISGLLIWSFTSCPVRAPHNSSPFDLQSVGQPGKPGGGGGGEAAAPVESRAVSSPEDGMEIVQQKPVKPQPKSQPKPKSTPVKIQSQVKKSATPQIKPPSKSDIQNMLGSAVKGIGSGSSAGGAAGAGSAAIGAYGTGTGGGVYDPLNWYYSMVQATMYEAWQQPSALAGTKGLMSRALIRVKRDGRIVRRSIDQSSGNTLMDASVMSAVEFVQQLQPLPPGFGGDYKDITIEFKLKDPSFGE